MAEDESYLNKRGLTHFWENIDDIKQDKLTAGAGISITGNVISATGGGTADAVDWGHITGSMSNQTDLTTALAAKANSADLATVATSGSYNDLTNKPTIPTVNNATLTIQKNGTNVQTFTANQSTNATANISVPTKTSDLTNDSGFITTYTDDKVKQELRSTSTTAQTYYPVASTVSSDNTAGVVKFSPLRYSQYDDNDDWGCGELILGNTDGFYTFYEGRLSLYDGTIDGKKTTILPAETLSSNQTVRLPRGVSTAGGRFVANSSGTAATGSATQPVYADANGILHATTYELNKTVPSDAVFTDTTYSNATTSAAGLMSAADKTKLNGIATGAEVNVQADWTQTTTTADDYIKNKPTLAAVATSGSYNDLSNKPTIPTVNNATLTIQKNGTTVKTFTANASSNVTANITVPTATSDLTNDSGFLTSVAWGDVTGKPTFATVATSGSYNDLSNKPTIPAAQVQSNWTQTTTTAVDYIKNKPTLAAVATSGSYNDLSNKPTIPTVNNATLTIQKNGSTVKTFTANASSNVTANITVPTKTSELTNDSGFLDAVAWGDVTGKPTFATVATSGSYNDLSNKPTIPTVNNATLTIQKNGTNVQTFTANQSTNATANITVPTKTSEITNDSGFLTSVGTANIADGAVTPAKMNLSSLGRFSGNLSGSSYSQSYTANTAANAKVPNQVFTPVGATYNTSTGAYTITQAGWWLITGGGRGTTDANATGAVRLHINGVNKVISTGTGYASSSNKTTFNSSVSWVGHLAANDTVALNIMSSVAMTNSNSATQQHLEGICLIPD